MQICEYCKSYDSEKSICTTIGYNNCKGIYFEDYRIQLTAIQFADFINTKVNEGKTLYKIDTGHLLTTPDMYKLFQNKQLIDYIEMIRSLEYIVIKIGIAKNEPKSLGDFLVYSQLPFLLKQIGYKKVFLSSYTHFRNEGIKHLILRNPYIDGIAELDPTFNGKDIDSLFSLNMSNQSNIMDIIHNSYGINTINSLPNLYYQPILINEYVGKVIYDPNCHTNMCGINIDNINKYFKDNNIKIDYQFAGRERYQVLLPDVPIITTHSIFNWIDILASASKTYSMMTGVNVVMAGISDYKGKHTTLYVPDTDGCINFWKFDNVNYVELDN